MVFHLQLSSCMISLCRTACSVNEQVFNAKWHAPYSHLAGSDLVRGFTVHVMYICSLNCLSPYIFGISSVWCRFQLKAI